MISQYQPLKAILRQYQPFSGLLHQTSMWTFCLLWLRSCKGKPEKMHEIRLQTLSPRQRSSSPRNYRYHQPLTLTTNPDLWLWWSASWCRIYRVLLGLHSRCRVPPAYLLQLEMLWFRLGVQSVRMGNINRSLMDSWRCRCLVIFDYRLVVQLDRPQGISRFGFWVAQVWHVNYSQGNPHQLILH